jgi:hypothetical protein
MDLLNTLDTINTGGNDEISINQNAGRAFELVAETSSEGDHRDRAAIQHQ